MALRLDPFQTVISARFRSVPTWTALASGDFITGGEHSGINLVSGCVDTVFGLNKEGGIVVPDYWTNADHGEDQPPSGTYQSMAGRGVFGLALSTSGDVVHWGQSEYGQDEVPLDPCIAIGAGYWHGHAIAPDGSLRSWGHPSEDWVTSPADEVPPGQFKYVTGGDWFAMALTVDGELVVYGGRDYDKNQVRDKAPGGEFLKVTAGSGWGAGIRPDGSVEVWGDDYNDIVSHGAPSGKYIDIYGGYDNCVVQDQEGGLYYLGYEGDWEGVTKQDNSVQVYTCYYGICAWLKPKDLGNLQKEIEDLKYYHRSNQKSLQSKLGATVDALPPGPVELQE